MRRKKLTAVCEDWTGDQLPTLTMYEYECGSKKIQNKQTLPPKSQNTMNPHTPAPGPAGPSSHGGACALCPDSTKRPPEGATAVMYNVKLISRRL